MKTALLLSLLIALSTSALAGEKEDAIALVNDAALAVIKDKSAAIALVNDKNGRFAKGERYVFVYDLNGSMVEHPINARLIGKNLLDGPGADGKLFRKEILAGVQASGSASVGYKYKNPRSGLVEEKISFAGRRPILQSVRGITTNRLHAAAQGGFRFSTR